MTQSPSSSLLSVRGLTVELPIGGEFYPAVDGVDFDLAAGESLAIIGESGCGKTLLARALLDLPPEGARVSGDITLEGVSLRGRSDREWCRLRGGALSLVFQEPGSALDPVRTVGDQIVEAIRAHRPGPADEARRTARDLLREVSFSDAERAQSEYGHRLSGGERQRACLAIALAANPKVLIADEPTSSLDATIAAEVLELLENLRRQRGLSLILISHDLAAVARATDRALVLYAGRVVEEGTTSSLFRGARHPYTRGLVASAARPRSAAPGERFPAIAGAVPDLACREPGSCAFAPRCPERFSRCDQEEPVLLSVDSGRARCFLYEAAGESAPRNP
ncbi:MAG TPA: ABC transporter ATP-binding protein [Thermoanaerobaculia bacterium]